MGIICRSAFEFGVPDGYHNWLHDGVCNGSACMSHVYSELPPTVVSVCMTILHTRTTLT